MKDTYRKTSDGEYDRIIEWIVMEITWHMHEHAESGGKERKEEIMKMGYIRNVQFPEA